MKEISIEIDSLGRVKKKGKGLGQQYESKVTKYVIGLDSALMDPNYFYYLVVVPPSASGKSMYAVPMLTEKFEYIISSAVTQYIGTFKFCMLIMQKEFTDNVIPVDGVVNISDEWEDEVEKGILKPDELAEVPQDINFKIAYDELLLLKAQLESDAEYAKKQATYAKNVADQLLADKENGVFNGAPGPKGDDGVSPTATVERNNAGALFTVKDGQGITTTQLKDGSSPYIGPNGNWWVGEGDTGVSPNSEYELSPAGKTFLGGVIVGDNLDVTEEGKISVADTPKYNDEVVLSGAEIEVNNVISIESILSLSGNSEQDSRSGKNLLKKGSEYVSKTSCGITFTVNEDESVTLNGTNDGTGNSIVRLWDDSSNPIVIPAGTYKTGRSGHNKVEIKGYDGNSYKTFVNNSQDTFTLTNDMSCKMVYIQVPNGTTDTFSNLTVYPIMTKDTDNVEPYEPYGLKPSPDYPSEIRSVKSKSDNLFDIATKKNNKALTWAGGIESDSSGAIASDFMPIGDIKKLNSNYTFSAYYYDSSKTYLGNGPDLVKDATSGGYKNTVVPNNSNITYFRVWYRNSSGGNPSDMTTITDIMLNKGTKALPYQPYGYVPVEVKVEGKNKFDANAKNLTAYKATSVVDGNKIKVTQVADSSAQYVTMVIPNYKELLGKEVTLSVSCITPSASNNGRVALFKYTPSTNTYSTVFASLTSAGSKTVTLPDTLGAEENQVVMLLYSNQNGTATTGDYVIFEDVQLELGSTVTSYEPYKLTTVSLPLGDIELRSTPDGTRDTFERVDGVWNYRDDIYSEILDGTGTVTKSEVSTVQHGYYFSARLSKTAKYPNRDIIAKMLLSTLFKVIPNYTENLGIGCMTLSSAKDRVLFFIDEEVTTVEECTTWLSANRPHVQYVLATPTYTPITDQALISALDELESLILHQGYNYITATAVNGVKAQLDLSIPSTASVTNVTETESGQDLIVPVVSETGNVKIKFPMKEENQMKINPSTGLVKVRGLEIGGKKAITESDLNGYATEEFVSSSINSAINSALEGSY